MIARWIKIKIKIRMMSQIRKIKGARASDWANSRAGFLAISVKKIRGCLLFFYRESPRMRTAPLFLTADRGKREAVVIGKSGPRAPRPLSLVTVSPRQEAGKGARAPDWANSRAGFLAISV